MLHFRQKDNFTPFSIAAPVHVPMPMTIEEISRRGDAQHAAGREQKLNGRHYRACRVSREPFIVACAAGRSHRGLRCRISILRHTLMLRSAWASCAWALSRVALYFADSA